MCPRRSVVHSCFHCSKPYVCMGLEEAMSPRSVVSCCKSCSSCFPCVHVASLHFPEEPCFDPGPCLPRVAPRPTWLKIPLPRPASQRGGGDFSIPQFLFFHDFLTGLSCRNDCLSLYFQKPVDGGADMNAFAFYHNITCRGHGYERQLVTTQSY